MVKRLPAMRETWVRSLGREDPWRRKSQPTPVLLPGKFHGQRSLVSYSPWDCKESDKTEKLHFIYMYIYEVGISIFQIRKLKLEEIRSNCYKQLKWKTRRKNSLFMRVSVHEINLTSK